MWSKIFIFFLILGEEKIQIRPIFKTPQGLFDTIVQKDASGSGHGLQ